MRKFLLAAFLSFLSLSANADYTFNPNSTLPYWNPLTNASGQVAGTSVTRNNLGVGLGNYYQATLDNIGLGTLGGENSYASGINSSGQVVGGIYNQCYMWSNAECRDAYDFGGSGSVHPTLGGVFNTNAALWDNGTALLLPSFTGSIGGVSYAINDSTKIVGYSVTANNYYHATLWSNGTATNIGAQIEGSHFFDTSTGIGLSNGSFQSVALDINASGEVVGYIANNTNMIQGYLDREAVLWSGGSAINLNSLLSASEKSAGWVLRTADYINDSGSIQGVASNRLLGITTQSYVLAAVPEVDSSSMLLMGLVLMGFIARREKYKFL